ncbi:uncharacterized protein LOC119742920 [Patiria miniata]|uniref:ATP-dependent DNA helicase n=1 Tax=Patiria miniata TaxID=46514 RepID=A0A914BI52_PATMI|nr:uncharacterized protein LOC119742920 [Patiria miniata]XP_038075108.1 uncharacterized protein LOC119742920 [Patiria miniata]XP_038075109.1 uncharacterized protein LOC119742920 [Patiria miniata]XP_038075110.1 uncharacterized protein LOC119742920 [Patiria miniata]XP_038075111.1 uncharacterized protein LOC119742920 [Patiria miniata]XP_038075112.1 uncharacterized protein LOC119742920 [Patiria miniata]
MLLHHIVHLLLLACICTHFDSIVPYGPVQMTVHFVHSKYTKFCHSCVTLNWNAHDLSTFTDFPTSFVSSLACSQLPFLIRLLFPHTMAELDSSPSRKKQRLLHSSFEVNQMAMALDHTYNISCAIPSVSSKHISPTVIALDHTYSHSCAISFESVQDQSNIPSVIAVDHTYSSLSTISPTTQVSRLPTHSSIGFALSDIDSFQEQTISCNPNQPSVLAWPHNSGQMSHECPHCHALLYSKERSSTNKFNLCCRNGKVKLTPTPTPPEPLQTFLTSSEPSLLAFRKQIRTYNNALTMTSLGCKEQTIPGQWMPTFKIQGQVHHLIGSLLPAHNTAPKFSQLFIYDTEHELDNRHQGHAQSVCKEQLQQLQEMLHLCNSYVRSFKMAAELGPLADNSLILHADHQPKSTHPGQYHQPTSEQIAILLPGSNEEPAGKRDIVLTHRDGQLQRIHETHRSYDPLHYVLLFPHGEDGWHIGLKEWDATKNKHSAKTLSMLAFYKFHIMVRNHHSNSLHRSGKLFLQFLVDMYAKVEQNRLRWIRNNQQQLRADTYKGLCDAIAADDVQRAGKSIILPSSFPGSPRYMHQKYLDSIAIVRKYGKPDIFLTFTCNPSWPEITTELLPSQRTHDRPDLTTRVFNLKWKALLHDILKDHILGKVLAYCYTIEFQKRGLPHAHLLLILHPDYKPMTPDHFDQITCAELPDPTTNPSLYKIVTSSMIHGPCGHFNTKSPCMKDNSCSKCYPKHLSPNTLMGNDSYPIYRRRNMQEGGRTAMLNLNRRQEVQIDNSWVVPYNPYLLLKYQGHMNVEICSSIKAVKYLYKYIYKGADRVVVSVNNTASSPTTSTGIDEVSRYIDARYISASDAYWRLTEMPLNGRYPNVVRLAVHLPNHQHVCFSPNKPQQSLLNDPPKTTLTQWFALNASDTQARTLYYQDIPMFYTWNQSAKKWIQRKQNTSIQPSPHGTSSDTVGRMYAVHPSQGELFYLRLLLHHVQGPTSFPGIRTIHGNVCETYKEACEHLGLLDDDNEWDKSLTDASEVSSSSSMRDLFVTILVFCQPSNPQSLWNKHKDNLAEDFKYTLRKGGHHVTSEETLDIIYNEALLDIDNRLNVFNKTVTDYGLPQPNKASAVKALSHAVREELHYDTLQQDSIVQTRTTQMTPDQKAAYTTISSTIDNKSNGIYFIDAPGGTGKTFLLNSLLAYVRSKGHIALAVASSGIAATLLVGGRTAHSRFKIPLEILPNSTCNISPRDSTADLIRLAEIIIWDEAPMTHRHSFEALNRTMQDILQSDLPFGGKVIVLAGDFRQILPVVRHGTRGIIVNATLKRSPLWQHVQVLSLTTNMRVHLTQCADSNDFSKFLLQIGNGSFPTVHDNTIAIPSHIASSTQKVQDLIDHVFPDISDNYTNNNWISSRTILATTNKDVDDLNEIISKSIPEDSHTFNSADTVPLDQNPTLYPTEFLNTLTPTGLPPHKLQLQKHTPIMLLRNLNPSQGHCNGSRYVITHLTPNIIHAVATCGTHAGKTILIPRIPMMPADNLFPFKFYRRQFPIRPSFAITINKSQGQTLSQAGVLLHKPVFTHGQLYVALSRVGSSNAIQVMTKEHEHGSVLTTNIVYPEIFV